MKVAQIAEQVTETCIAASQNLQMRLYNAEIKEGYVHPTIYKDMVQYLMANYGLSQSGPGFQTVQMHMPGGTCVFRPSPGQNEVILRLAVEARGPGQADAMVQFPVPIALPANWNWDKEIDRCFHRQRTIPGTWKRDWDPAEYSLKGVLAEELGLTPTPKKPLRHAPWGQRKK